MNPFAPPPLYRRVPVVEVPIAAILRAQTYDARAEMTPRLREALDDCGCWTRSRSGSATGLVLLFELSLRSMAELYLALIECGLEFDRKGHCELSMLCTLGRHSAEAESLRRNVTLRLELTFLDELEPAALCLGHVHA